MRLPTLLALALLAGCATAHGGRPTTIFPPAPDANSQAGQHDQGQVWVLEHKLNVHPDCYAVDRGKGAGIIRCGVGQLEWVVTRDIAEGVDDFDQLKDAMKWDAEHNGEQMQDQAVECTMVGTPATCHAFVFTPHDGSAPRSTIIGTSQLEGQGLVAQCVSKAGGGEQMKPVCGEIFVIK
jgi:hypothetical protein